MDFRPFADPDLSGLSDAEGLRETSLLGKMRLPWLSP